MRNSTGKPTGAYTGRANKIGGGGWTHHLVQSSNGDWLFCTHDTLGASKRYRTDTEWTPLITNDTLPAGFFGTGAPATSDGQVSNKADNARGCWGIEVAKSDDTRLYAGLDGWVIRSDNRGGTWTKTTLAAKTMQANLNEFRNWNNKIAVHPTDKNIVVVGSMEGSNYSTDGGTTWNAISVAAGSILNTYYQSPHTFAFKQDGSKVYCHRYGTGIYEATTLAGPWTLLNATNYPTSATHMVTDATGNLWVCDPSGTAGSNIRKWNGTTWTIYSIGGSELFHTIALDPANNSKITVAGQYGALATSTDGGLTWVGGGYFNSNYPGPEGVRLIANQVPWLAKNNWRFVPSTLLYRAGATNEVWMVQGIGAVRSNPPSTLVRWDWTDESAGIEQMVTAGLIARPNRTPIIAGFHDKTVIVSNSPDIYPTSFGPQSNDYSLVDCWYLDYAKDNEDYVVAAITGNNSQIWTPFTSVDGGNNWTQTPYHPDGNGAKGGTIACNRQGQVIWFPRGTNIQRPVRLAADGLSWTVMTFPGVASNYLEGQAFYVNHHCVTADKENSGHFYAILSTNAYPDLGLYKTTDGGATWTQKVTGQINTSYTDYWNIQLSCVPGQSGHCYYTSGRDFTGPFTRTTDGWTSKSTVPNVDSVVCFGFGKSAPGQTYPAIYFVGRVSGVNGYYVTFDNFATAPIFIGTWIGNWVDIPARIAGDWNVFGRFYVGMSGSSVRVGNYGKQAKF